MLASFALATPVTLAIPAPRLQPTGSENLFKRLDSDGNGRLTVADRASAVISLSPQAAARYAEAANQGAPAEAAEAAGQAAQRASAPTRGAEQAAARYGAVQAMPAIASFAASAALAA